MLIRDVPDDDLEQIRSAAAAKGASVQSYLLDAVHAQATYLRRQASLIRTVQRLHGRPGVPADDRDGVLAAVDDAHTQRDDQLSGRRER